MSNLIHIKNVSSQKDIIIAEAMKKNDCPPNCNKTHCDECPFRVKSAEDTKIKPELYGKDF